MTARTELHDYACSSWFKVHNNCELTDELIDALVDEETANGPVRAHAYRDAAADLEADAARLATSDPRAVEVLTGAAYLLRTRADGIAAAIPAAPAPHLPACAHSGPNPGTRLCVCPPRPCSTCGRLCDDPEGSI